MPTVNIYLTTSHAACQHDLETRYLPQLPGSEQQRYKDLHPQRQIEWLHARALLHTALSTHYGVNDGLQYLKRHPSGGLHFPAKSLSVSISHSQDTIGVAISDNTIELGLDLEAIQPRKLIEQTQKIFTPAENAWLDKQPPEQRLSAFYQLWTLKEACIKACRQSIWLGLQTLAFDFSASDFFTSQNPIFQGHWQLAWGAPQANRQIALAVKNGNKINKLQLWQANSSTAVPALLPYRLNARQIDCKAPD